MKSKLIAIGVVVLLALVILIQNSHVVTFRLLWWKAEMSQLIVVLLTLGIGFVLGLITGTRPRKRVGG